MKRLIFHTLVLVLIGPSVLLRAAPTAAKPNILFIFADDWGWGDLGCHGHPYVRTPNIDRLAREGTDFTRFTVASGVCSPSRAAVLTGHFPARYNIDGHFAHVPTNARRNMPDWLDPSAPMLPRMLKTAGYATAHFGKWHLGNDMIPDSPVPATYGFDVYGAFNCAGEQMPVHEDANHAIDFIRQCAEAKQPFFVNLWIHEPHTPFHTVPKYEWRFRHLEDHADRIYASVLSHADDRIGQVLNALDALGLTESTLVIFSSDNGPARAAKPTKPSLMYDTATGAGWGIGAAKGITAGRKGYKAALFEGGINVPFIARWPGKIPAGQIDDKSLISAVDLLPTFCELAGAELPASYVADGVSQWSVLQGNPAPVREKPLFWRMSGTWPPAKERPFHWATYVVVFQHWKLLANKATSHLELYDLRSDALEQRNLQSDRPDVVRTLLVKLDQWKATLPAKPTGPVFSAERRKLNEFKD